MRVRCSRSLWFYVELKYNSLNLDFYLVVVNYGPRSAVESILGKKHFTEVVGSKLQLLGK